MRTVPVQIVCRKCGNPFRTTVRGGNTRCPHCKASRHVRLNQEWEGPIPASLSAAEARAQEVARRPPVWLECLHCGHEWQSQAKDGTVLHCPSCHAGKRVPRRAAHTGPLPPSQLPPSPREYRPEPSRRRQTVPTEPYEDDYEDDYEDEEESRPVGFFQALGRASQAASWPLVTPPAPGALGGLLGALFGRPAASAAPRAPEPEPVVPAPPRPLLPIPPRPAPASTPTRTPAGPPRGTRGPAPDPVDVSTLPAAEVKRRDAVCQLVRATGSMAVLVWYNQPRGLCEVLDASQHRDKQRCPERAAYAVRFTMGASEGHAYACAAHVGLLASVAEGAEYVSATIHRA